MKKLIEAQMDEIIIDIAEIKNKLLVLHQNHLDNKVCMDVAQVHISFPS